MKKRISYTVLNINEEVLYKGYMLSELIETIIINTLKKIDNKYSIITKLEKDYYSYFCELNQFFLNSNCYNWESIKIIELIHNNNEFINEDDYIFFKKTNIKLKHSKKQLKYDKGVVI